MTKELIQLRVNGETREVAVPPSKLLLDVLREDLGLTGSKRGCDDSSCGACAVLADGVPILACVAIGSCYQETRIITVEGLDRKSTRLNSSHLVISYAVFCLKKKKKIHM